MLAARYGRPKDTIATRSFDQIGSAGREEKSIFSLLRGGEKYLLSFGARAVL